MTVPSAALIRWVDTTLAKQWGVVGGSAGAAHHQDRPRRCPARQNREVSRERKKRGRWPSRSRQSAAERGSVPDRASTIRGSRTGRVNGARPWNDVARSLL